MSLSVMSVTSSLRKCGLSRWRIQAVVLPGERQLAEVEAVPVPGMASRVTPKEALAMQAFHFLKRCSASEIARRFHRKRETVRRALASAVISAGSKLHTSSTDDRDALDVRTARKEFYPMTG